MSVISTSTRHFLVETGYWMASGGDEDFERFVGDAFAGTDSALIDVSKGGGLMAVATSTQWSEIEVTATIYDSEPSPEAKPWDAVSDVTILVDPPGPEDEESCIGIMAGPVPEDEPDPIFLPCPTSRHARWHLRIHARVPDSGVEEHLLVFWPASDSAAHFRGA
ncbi:hypothetical protein AB0C52_24405 [Streptomyces sp. NPDC048717]|uniref:hypothetical protein n=1 Tax=Streptomyces sp. NPDC048717 TaxID=3154928 RepID=UPI003420C30A